MYRKRPRQDSTSNLPTMLNDFIEKPRTWNQETVSSSQITSANTSDIPSVAAAVSGLCDTMDDFSEIMKDMLQNPVSIYLVSHFLNLTLYHSVNRKFRFQFSHS